MTPPSLFTGKYNQFVTNRVSKIREHNEITWHHVPTSDNPADIGSREGSVTRNELWRKGPPWLSNPSEWPADKRLEATPETKTEAKQVKEIFAIATTERDIYDELLDKYQLHKLLRIGAWIRRFMDRCKKDCQVKETGPIKTKEIKEQQLWWIRRVQKQAERDPHFRADQQQLNLQPNCEQIFECMGRIVGQYPTYLPDSHSFTAKVVFQDHLSTIHGGIGITMSKVRERFWIPRLGRLA